MNSTNPIIRDFLNTNEPMVSVLEKYHNKDQYLESVFFALAKEMGGVVKKNESLLLSIDKAIIKGHPDINLFLLFITVSISYISRFNQLEKANSLCSIASSFSPEEIHPMVKAFFNQSRGYLYSLEGKNKESVKLMDESVAVINKNRPRDVVLLINYLTIIAAKGELKENGEYKMNQSNWSLVQEDSIMSKRLMMINAIITGNHEEGFILMEKYRKELVFHKKRRQDADYFGNLLKIFASDFAEASYQDNSFKYIANAFHYLSSGRYEEAIKYQKALYKENDRRFLLNEMVDYIPFHVELCLRKSGMAKLLLQERKQKGNFHFINDLFYGRAQLLENDLDGANETFSRLTDNINRFDAKNRLVFELQFAKEMKLADVLRLLDGWKSNKKNQTIKTKKVEISKPLLKEKGNKLLIGKSHAIHQVKELIKKYATLKAPVLITGETGTGKELVSRAIHEEGLYPEEPFLAINCGALTDTLLQSELFGYVSGAFTGAQKERIGIFEAAGKGTVFLDEFGDISPKLQVSLLRVLEANEIRLIGSNATRQINCKIVIATNVDLHIAVVEKKFREDLFFRLARFEIKIPALRERIEDLPELIHYFVSANNYGSEQNKAISKELVNALSAYHWPGNIRELKNEIERICILNPGQDLLGPEHFDFTHLQEPQNASLKPPLLKNNTDFKSQVNESQNDPILMILQKGFRVEQRHAKLKELFKKYKKLTRSHLVEITKVGASTITKDLQKLVDEGFIIRRTPTKSSSTDYFELVE